MAREVIVQTGQCLEDIALQEHGHVDGVTWLLQDNLSVLPDGYSTDLQPGTKLTVRDQAINAPVYKAIKRAGVVPATNTTVTNIPPPDNGDHDPADFNNDHNIGS